MIKELVKALFLAFGVTVGVGGGVVVLADAISGKIKRKKGTPEKVYTGENIYAKPTEKSVQDESVCVMCGKEVATESGQLCKEHQKELNEWVGD